jgi:caffeoyl-CoA O-methyltransferase
VWVRSYLRRLSSTRLSYLIVARSIDREAECGLVRSGAIRAIRTSTETTGPAGTDPDGSARAGGWLMRAIVDPEIETYAETHSAPEPPHLARLAEETRAVTSAPQMMVGPLEGALLRTLVAMSGARRVLEIGTFTGYSAISMAAALAPGGHIVTCEIDPRHAELARRHIEANDLADRIDVRLGRAIDTVRALEGPFDLVFIDADKESYADYYEAVLPLLSERGVICVDNVLWSGRILDEADADARTRAIAAFNEKVASDDRVEAVMLTIRDGLTLIRRR